jgi:hypothetical protein
MRLYPQVAPLLEDPKVRIHIDDGRRWMRARPDERFDLIFQNTTYHWRANATRLLSREYFELNKAHLAPGGILAVNSTGSRDVLVTAQAVFTHVRDYRGFVYMSDAPLVLQPRALETLRAARIGERPAFAATQFEGEGLGALILRLPFQEPAQLLARGSLAEPPRVNHDLNLIPEFRHGRSPLFGALKALLPPSPHPF